jgi:hypothetical protein
MIRTGEMRILMRTKKSWTGGGNPLLCCTALFLLVMSMLGSPVQPVYASEDLRAKVQNPVGNIYSVPFENNFDFGASNGNAYILNIQPVIPFTVGKVNLINRTIIPVIHVPGIIQGLPSIPEPPLAPTLSHSATGLGDINHSLFFSPAEPGKVIWGVGPSLSFPTATDSQLGSGKWCAGPTAVLLTQPKPWSLGILVRNLWSFAGSPSREDVNQFLVQPFVNYNLAKGWYLAFDPVITANWNKPARNAWVVPLGAGVGKLFNIGKLPINTRLLAYYNVVRPDGAPNWALRFNVQFIFPK